MTTIHTQRVRFAEKAEIREYPIIPGTNPCVRNGPPLSMGWKWVSSGAVSIHHQDSNGENKLLHPKPRKRSIVERQEVLKKLGYTRNEIQLCTKMCTIARNRRLRTYRECKVVSSAKEGAETVFQVVANAVTLGARDREQQAYFKLCGLVVQSGASKKETRLPIPKF